MGQRSGWGVLQAMTTNPFLRLTRQQRDTFRLLHECGWLYKAAAERRGVPEATIRTTVHRARLRANVGSRSELAYWMGVADMDIRSVSHTRSI